MEGELENSLNELNKEEDYKKKFEEIKLEADNLKVKNVFLSKQLDLKTSEIQNMSKTIYILKQQLKLINGKNKNDASPSHAPEKQFPADRISPQDMKTTPFFRYFDDQMHEKQSNLETEREIIKKWRNSEDIEIDDDCFRIRLCKNQNQIKSIGAVEIGIEVKNASLSEILFNEINHSTTEG